MSPSSYTSQAGVRESGPVELLRVIIETTMTFCNIIRINICSIINIMDYSNTNKTCEYKNKHRCSGSPPRHRKKSPHKSSSDLGLELCDLMSVLERIYIWNLIINDCGDCNGCDCNGCDC